MAGSHALATIDLSDVIERIAGGEYQSHIARELGLAPQRLHEVVSLHPGYREALKLRNMNKLDAAQGRIDCPDADLARAREAFKAAAWRAERECPDEWGRTDKLQVEHVGDLGDRLRRAKERIIEAEPAAIAAEQQALPKPK